MTRTVSKRINRLTADGELKVAKRPGLRERSAVVAKGRERADSILEAARHIIVLDGYSNFTLRKVAARVGIHLSNLQHYFPDRSALLRELLAYLNRRYSEDYAALMAVAGDDYEKQLRVLIDAVLEDGREPIMRGLYFQFWALSSNDEYILRIMEAGYTRYRKALAAAIKAMNPSLSARELQQRAILIQALIEGTHYLLRNRRGVLVPLPGSLDSIRREAMRIAKRRAG